MALTPQVVGDKVYWVEEGEQASPTGEAQDVGMWDILKKLPQGIGQTGGELISGTLSPNLSPLGGESNAQDYIMKHLESDPTQEWSWPREIAKATGRGVTKTFVPRSQVDTGAAIVGEAGGAAIAGGTAARRGIQEATDAASKAAAKSSATTKLQTAQRTPQNTWQGPLGGGPPPGYHTQRAANNARRGSDLPGPEYKGPRPTEQEFDKYKWGTGDDIGIPAEGRAGTTSPVGQAGQAADSANAAAANRAGSHQLDMARYRVGLEVAEEFKAKGLIPSPEDLDKIDDPVAREAVEKVFFGEARDAQAPGRAVASELGERREIGQELADRREIQQELLDRQGIQEGLRPGSTPTQPSAPPPPPATDRGATMPPPQGAPQGPATDRGATMPEMTGPTQRDVQQAFAQTLPPTPTPPQPPGAVPPRLDPEGRVPPVQGAAPPQPKPPRLDPQGRVPPVQQNPMKAAGEGGDVPPQVRALYPNIGKATQAAPDEVARQAVPPPEVTARMNQLDAMDDPVKAGMQVEGPATPPEQMPTMGHEPGSFEANQAFQEGLDPKVSASMEAMYKLPDQGHNRLNQLMQHLFETNPNMTLMEFMELMRKGGGPAGAPPLPY